MHIDQLIRMANQIGSFFEAMPDRAQAVEDTAQHIKKFWEPRMRRELLVHVDSAGNTALNDMVAQALARHRSVLE